MQVSDPVPKHPASHRFLYVHVYVLNVNASPYGLIDLKGSV